MYFLTIVYHCCVSVMVSDPRGCTKFWCTHVGPNFWELGLIKLVGIWKIKPRGALHGLGLMVWTGLMVSATVSMR